MNTNNGEKIKTVRLSESKHKKAKLKATEEGKTIKEYVEELIEEDTKKR